MFREDTTAFNMLPLALVDEQIEPLSIAFRALKNPFLHTSQHHILRTFETPFLQVKYRPGITLVQRVSHLATMKL